MEQSKHSHFKEENQQDDNNVISTSKVNNATLIGDTQSVSHDIFRMTNEGDMGVVQHDDSEIGDLTFSAIGQDLPHNIQAFLERPYRVLSHTWASGIMEPQKINPWLLFRENPAYSKLLGFYAVDFTYVFRLQTNTAPYTSGLLQMAFTPCIPGHIEILPAVDDQQKLVSTLSGGPSLTHNLSSSSVSEMRIRYKAPRPILDLNEREYGYLYLHSLTNLRGGSNNESCDIRVYMWLEDIHLYGANIRKARYEGQPLTQTQEAKAHDGPISGIANQVADISRTLTAIPVLADIAGPVSWVASAVGGIASMFGFSKPYDTSTSMSRTLNAYKEFVHGKGNWNVGTKLSVNDDASVAVHPLGPDGQDEMNINKLLQKPNFYNSFTWSTTNAPDTLLWASLITPTQFGISETVAIKGVNYESRRNTMMSYVAQLFGYWRGTIQLTFTVVATKFHSGRLRFVYTPEPNPTREEVIAQYNHAYTHIMDVRDATTFTIDIPFISSTPWKRTSTATTIDSCVGQIFVFAENFLIVGGEAGTTVDIAVHVSGKDFQFAVPRRNIVEVLNGKGTTPPAKQVEDVVTEGFRQAQYQGLTDNVQQEAPMAINIANTTKRDVPEVAHQLSMGDPITSLRTLAKRLDVFAVNAPVSEAYISFNVNGNDRLDSLSQPKKETLTGYLRLIQAIYAFRSGGTRFVVKPQLGVEVVQAQLVENYEGDTRTQSNSDAVVHSSPTASSRVVARLPHDGGTAMQVEVPYYTIFPMLWNAPQLHNLAIYNTYSETESSFYLEVNVSGTGNVDIYHSGADDFNCGYIIGAPLTWLPGNEAPPESRKEDTKKDVSDWTIIA